MRIAKEGNYVGLLSILQVTTAPKDQMSAGVPQGIPTQDSGLRQYGFVIMRHRSSSRCDAVRLSASVLELSACATKYTNSEIDDFD